LRRGRALPMFFALVYGLAFFGVYVIA